MEMTSAYCAADWPERGAKCCAVPLTEVEARGYLGRRIDRNLDSLLLGLKGPIPQGFESVVAGVEPPAVCNRLAADSDLYKWLEGASYVFARTGDRKIKGAIDRIAGLISECQHLGCRTTEEFQKVQSRTENH